MHLITLNQAKMLKSAEFGYISAILNLAPAFKYKGENTCPMAGQCKAFCLQHTGHNRFPTAHAARERRTKLYYDDPTAFYTLLRLDLTSLLAKAKEMRLAPTMRLNGLSDLPWERGFAELFRTFSELQFIDYTKLPYRMFGKLPKNYHLTYSINEKTPPDMVESIYANTPYNCAAVFDVKRGEPLPKTHTINGRRYPVIDGDHSDLRHLDERGAIVGLRYKIAMPTGKGLKAKRGFIILKEEHERV